MQYLRNTSHKRGFTLLEILLVVAAIAILATVIILALNPNKQLGDTRNAKRKVDQSSITDAIAQYQIDHGKLPGPDLIPVGTEMDAKEICKTNITDSSCLNLSDLTDNNIYLSSIPIDPSIISGPGSGYTIYQSTANNKIVVLAPNIEISGGERGNNTNTVSTPTVDIPADIYTSPQDITLATTTSGATIYYTTDGSDPTSSSTPYSSPINIFTTTTLKAIAIKSGMTDSGIFNRDYIFISEPFAGGSGTVDDPYQVATSNQLNNIRYLLNKHFIQVNDIDLNIAPYNTGTGFIPIGDSLSIFSGTFSGGGYTISNLYINASGVTYVGLFGIIGGAYDTTIQNLKLINVNIYSVNDHVGALVGASIGANITNCSSTGSVTGNDYVGGLVGNDQGYVSNSWSSASVFGHDYVGGLIGIGNSSSENNSYARGNVTGNDYVGGFAGNKQGATWNDNYSTGLVTGVGSNVGGFVGNNNYIINDSYYDSITSGRGDAGNGDPETTTWLKTQSNYPLSWNFTTIWNMDGITNDGYPFLR